MAKQKVSFTLSEDAMRLLKVLAEKKGLSMASFIELTIRDIAKREKVS